jgi:hypothetical protein
MIILFAAKIINTTVTNNKYSMFILFQKSGCENWVQLFSKYHHVVFNGMKIIMNTLLTLQYLCNLNMKFPKT